MTWVPNTVVTIDGTTYTDKTLFNLSVNYGRSNVWEQARAGYAQIQLINLTNADYTYDVNDPVTITIDDSAGNPVTIFTGTITDIGAQMQNIGSIGFTCVETITAVSVFAQMSRVVVGTTSYPKEYDDDRLTRIFNECGVTIDSVDVGVYEFTARSASPTDGYSLAAKYASQAFGYIYETTINTVGYANESHRTILAQSMGYFVIPNDYIIAAGLRSDRSFNDITNDVVLSYKANATVTSQDAISIATYGTRAASIGTELENAAEAQLNADRYVTLRAYPQTSLSSFQIAVDSPFVSNADRDTLIDVFMGLPIQITTLPLSISHVAYRGFVEGWSWQIRQKQAFLTLNTTDNTLSLAPTRWQDVSAALQWEDVDPALQWLAYE